MQNDEQPMNAQAGGLDALAGEPWVGRAILLVDLDAFFASVEQLDHPGWRGKPVIVGGDPDRRGVVSTASYEARRFGVRSAMPSSTARKLCPDAIWTEGHYSRYREMSNKVMAILHDETPLVQQVSIDEAFMDVTPTAINNEHPVAIAQRIQSRVEALGVTCSIGVGTTKSVAKIASDMDKPRGLTVVFPGGEPSFLDPLPTKALSGVGPAAQKTLASHGIVTLGDVRRSDEEFLLSLLGKQGQMIYRRTCGLEDDSIVTEDEVKSVSCETSFAEDLRIRDDVAAAVGTMAAKVGRRLRKKGLAGKTVALKVRYSDLSSRSAQTQLPAATDDEYELLPKLYEMLDELWSEGMGLRLVGVAVSGFSGEVDGAPEQLSLFGDDGAAPTDKAGQKRSLLNAADLVRDRFGESALQFGRELRLKGADTGSSSKNPADYK